MTESYDAIVIGGGVVGAATAFNLKKLGCDRVMLMERDQTCSGSTAKSCAIVRTHYSIPTNTQLAVQSLGILPNIQPHGRRYRLQGYVRQEVPPVENVTAAASFTLDVTVGASRPTPRSPPPMTPRVLRYGSEYERLFRISASTCPTHNFSSNFPQTR